MKLAVNIDENLHAKLDAMFTSPMQRYCAKLYAHILKNCDENAKDVLWKATGYWTLKAAFEGGKTKAAIKAAEKVITK